MTLYLSTGYYQYSTRRVGVGNRDVVNISHYLLPLIDDDDALPLGQLRWPSPSWPGIVDSTSLSPFLRVLVFVSVTGKGWWDETRSGARSRGSMASADVKFVEETLR